MIDLFNEKWGKKEERRGMKNREEEGEEDGILMAHYYKSVVRLSSAIEKDIIDCKEAGNTHKAPCMTGTKSVTIHPTLQPPSVRATND